MRQTDLMARVGRRIRRESLWYLRYRWNPLNKNRIVKTFQADVEGVRADLSEHGISYEPLTLSPKGFQHYLASCAYPTSYFGGLGIAYKEKALEHYLSLELLQINKDDVYLDVASSSSPFPGFVKESIGCKVYINDLNYPAGITEDWRIGSDATRLPLADDSISRATLHCSFEHFEGDSDTHLIWELSRVLCPGGKVCIVPLYLHTRYLGLTDPTVDRTGLQWDPAMDTLLCKGYAERHGRFYSVAKLRERIYSQLGPLKPRLYNVQNLNSVAEGLWCQWILILEKHS